MNLEFTPNAWEEYEYWIKTDIEILLKINELLHEIKRHPFKGLGKPEPLKNALQGFWSRRITDEHRLVYRVSGKPGIDQKCSVIQCKFHY
jgi:toxin YoeB